MASSDTGPSQSRHSFCFGLLTIRAPWYIYFGITLVAVLGNYLIYLSFQYTSFAFVYLVDALAIPSAVLFSKVILKRKYKATHILGVTVCVAGIVGSTISDLTGNADADADADADQPDEQHDTTANAEQAEIEQEEFKAREWGDQLAIVGSILLGLDDVLSEMAVKRYGGVDELLFMKGFFGTWICAALLAFVEQDDLQKLFGSEDAVVYDGEDPSSLPSCNTSTRALLLLGYVICQSTNLVGQVYFLKVSEAALLNLSLLTSDLWAVMFSIVFSNFRPSLAYYLGAAMILLGIVLYEAGPSPDVDERETPVDIKFRTTKWRLRGFRTGGGVDDGADKRMGSASIIAGHVKPHGEMGAIEMT